MGVENFNINVLLNSNGVASGARRVISSLNSSLINPIKGMMAGILGVGALFSGARNVMDFAGRIKDLSDKLGVGTSELQEFAYAAEQTGSNLEDVATALKRISISKVSALGGNKVDVASFGRFGIGKEQLAGMSPDQILVKVLGQMKDVGASSQQMSDTINLMGRSADTLIPAAREGFGELIDKAREAGLAMSPDLINRLDEAGDAMNAIKWRLRTDLAPGLATLIEYAAKLGIVFAAIVAGGIELASGLKNMVTWAGPDWAAFGKGWTKAQERMSNILAPLFMEPSNKPKTGSPLITEPIPVEDVKAKNKSSFTMPSADALTRMGLFIGGMGSFRNIQKSQLAKLGEIKDVLTDMNKNLNISI